MKSALLLLLLALALPGAGFAAEPAQPEADSTNEEPEVAAADASEEADDADPIVAEAESTTGSATASNDDTFVPTVQISEDLSVSFPADI